MEDLKVIEVTQLHNLLVEYTKNYVIVESETASEKKIEYCKKINELLTEIERRKENSSK